MLNVAQVQ